MFNPKEDFDFKKISTAYSKINYKDNNEFLPTSTNIHTHTPLVSKPEGNDWAAASI